MDRTSRRLVAVRIGYIFFTKTFSVRAMGTVTERCLTMLAAVLVVACLTQNSVESAALRNVRHRGSRRSRADPNRPVTSSGFRGSFSFSCLLTLDLDCFIQVDFLQMVDFY